MTNDAHRSPAPVHGGWDDDELFDRAAASDVPHETTLAKVGRVVVGVQSVVLLVIAIAGFVDPGGTFLALRVTVAHAVLLLVTAVVVGAAVFAPAKLLRRALLVQTVVYLLVAAFGLAVPNSLGLNGPDHILHAVLFLLGFAGSYVLAAGILEPGELGSDPSKS